ncbi:MAG TPA: inositol monophosphatase family protein [Candidatus Brocadiia bacterium]|nr:inositol monophosphatase family protein [Candidatus Brocadiia bacterium]
MLETAILAARRAGQELLAAWTGELEVLSEDAGDIKLAMDRRAEDIILSAIRRRFPGHAILSEERGRVQGAEFTWVVDPLDGTHNYSRHVPYWCVCVAAYHGNEPFLGVVYDPIHNHLFSAERGKGAFLNGQPIRVNAERRLPQAVVAFGCYHKLENSVRSWMRRTQVITPAARSTRNFGAAGLHCAYAAAGWADAFVEYGVMPWDVGAGHAIVLEAGGRFISWPVEDGGLDVVMGAPLVCEDLLALGLWRPAEESKPVL